MDKILCKREFKFEGDPEILAICSKDVKDYFSSEFMKRRKVFVDYVNSCYETWNKEFNRKFPCSVETEEYLNFIKHKQERFLSQANNEDILLNEVKLYIDEDCDICGFVEKFNIKIHSGLHIYKKGSE